MIVLAKKNGKTGELNTVTKIFTERQWSPEETARYLNLRGEKQLEIDQKIINSKKSIVYKFIDS